MKICILYIPCTWPEMPRSFVESLLNMTSFEVQEELRKKHDISIRFMISDTFPIDRNRNEAFELAITRYNADFMVCLDADQTFPRETLLNLFESIEKHPEYDVISGVYFKKSEPNGAVVGSYLPYIDSEMKKSLIELGLADDNGQYLFYRSATSFAHGKPFPIDVSGMGCLLVRLDCIKRLKQPYFKYFDSYQFSDWPTDGSSEEMIFFAKLKQAGVKVLCDPRILCGHLREAEIALVGDSVLCV